MSWKLLVRIGIVICLLWMICACTADSITLQPVTAQPLAATSVSPANSPAATGDSWQEIEPGMELRTLRLSAGGHSGFVTALRFTPSTYKISVKYDVGNPGRVSEWFDALAPIAVINGGYFDEQGRPTALVIFDGVRRGESYDGFGGMVVINEQGEFELRSLRDQPFDPSEQLQQAMQSSPMLIQPGGTLSNFEANDDRSRRTVIARDRSGRTLLIVGNAPSFTLAELAQALKDSDLDLDAALNLDGGRSTGLYLRTPAASVTIDSYEQVPLVLVIERR